MKVLKAAVVTLFLIAAGVVAALFVGIPAHFVAGPVQNELEAATGYRLSISGSSWLRILPSPTIELKDISLIDTRTTGVQGGMTAESLRLSADLRSLFSERPQITEAMIVRPVLRSPLQRHRSASSGSSTTRATGASKDNALRLTIEQFAVRDGEVHFVDEKGGVDSKLEKIEVAGFLTPDDLIDITASARSGDQALSLKLKGKAPPSGFDGSPIPVEFAFELPGLLNGPVSGTAEIRPSGSLVRVNSVNGAIGPNKFSGWATVDATDKPLVNVDLDFQRLDIGTLRAPGTGTGVEATPATIDQPWATTPIDLDGLNFFDAQIQVSIASLNIETFHFAPITISATVNNGIVQVAFPQIGLYGGQASGGIAANVSTPQYAFAIRMDFYDVRALPLLTDVANFTMLDGKMQAKIDLRAWGQNERALMSSLEGTMDVVFQDGEIRSMNIAQMIRDVGSTILSGWQAGKTEKTDFAQLSASFQFDRGQGTTNNLQLVGPLVRVPGAGTVDVGAKTLNFRLDPKLVMSLQGQGATQVNPMGLGVPVLVQGSWGQPKIYPEVAGILENPDAAFARLKELGLGFLGGPSGQQGQQGQQGPGANPQTGPGNILQGIGDILKGFGNNPAGGQPSTAQPSTPRR